MREFYAVGSWATVAMTFRSVEDLGEMVCIGLGLPQKMFRDAGRYGYVSVPFHTPLQRDT